MNTHASLLFHLVTALSAALVGGFVAAMLRQPAIIGYLLAGLLIGPFTPGFIGDPSAIDALAEVGIVFLMFTIGVQFSFKDFIRVGKPVIFGALVQVGVMAGIGVAVGQATGWSSLEALFFGAAVSNSSSTVLGKVLGQTAGESGFGRTALAWSSVQDLSTVVLIPLLTALASARGVGAELGWALVKATFFLLVLVPSGVFLLPRLLSRVASLRSRELFVLTAGCIALGLSYLSGLLGVSVALGAFLAGAVVGDSDLAHRVQSETIPLRDLFSGLFFVSVGMLVDPMFIAGRLGTVLWGAALILVAKGALIAGLVRVMRYSWPASVGIGAGLAQCGEFSLLMARFGADVGAVSLDTLNILLGATALSILLSPHVMRGARPLAKWLARTGIGDDEHGPLPAEQTDHVIVCGHGRVGQVVTSMLKEFCIPFTVIEEDDHAVRALRRAGLNALVGDASRPTMLEKAGIERARVIVVAIPERLAVRQILDQARSLNPSIAVIARTHTQRERGHLSEMGVSEAILGELELALALARRALEIVGLDPSEVQKLADQVRATRP